MLVVLSYTTLIRVALIGCGDISGQYLAELSRHRGLPQGQTWHPNPAFFSARGGGALLDSSGVPALHVLGVMEGLLASARAGGQRVATSTSEPLVLAA